MCSLFQLNLQMSDTKEIEDKFNVLTFSEPHQLTTASYSIQYGSVLFTFAKNKYSEASSYEPYIEMKWEGVYTSGMIWCRGTQVSSLYINEYEMYRRNYTGNDTIRGDSLDSIIHLLQCWYSEDRCLQWERVTMKEVYTRFKLETDKLKYYDAYNDHGFHGWNKYTSYFMAPLDSYNRADDCVLCISSRSLIVQELKLVNNIAKTHGVTFRMSGFVPETVNIQCKNQH